MNVLVCIKQVPDNSVVPKLDPNTNRVVTEGVELMESPFDLNAVEAGLKLVEENGGEVSVLTLGGESAKTSLRYGLSMGAAKAYLLKDPAFEESDSWGTSYGLAKAIQSIGQIHAVNRCNDDEHHKRDIEHAKIPLHVEKRNVNLRSHKGAVVGI